MTDITATNIKTGSRNSISDIALQQMKIRDYLTSEWLNGINLANDVKSLLREIFASLRRYRRMYNPGALPDDAKATVDSTFLFNWSAPATDTLNFFEMAIFSDSPQIHFSLRQAV